MSSPTPAQNGPAFFLDTEKARAAVTQLRKVYAQLADLKHQAFLLAQQPPTAHDPVSLEAFELLRLKADGPPGSGSFGQAMQGGMDHVMSLIDQMEVDIRRQEELDAHGQQEIRRA